MLRRYQRKGHVWTIERTNTRIATTLDGVETVEDLADDMIAVTRLDVLVKQHVRDGWRRISDEPEPPPEDRPVLPPQPDVHDARNLDLERAIIDAPLEIEPYRVYGDWLEQQGDPRGRLIALQIARHERGRDQKLALVLNAFISKHRTYFFGTPIRGCVTELGFGFFRTVRVIVQRIKTSLDKVLRYPSARFVTALELFGDRTGRLDEAIEYLGAHAPATLRHLELGGARTLDHVEPLVPLLPQLHHFAFKNVHERRLDLSPRCLDTIVASPLPRLRSLQIDFEGDRFVAASPVPQLRKLFARTDVPALTTLRFRSIWDDAILAELVDHPLAAQLEVMQLENLTDEGAQTLLAHRNVFARMRQLELGSNRTLSADVVGELACFVEVGSSSSAYLSRYPRLSGD